MQSGPGFVPTFLYYFVSTTLIVTFVIAKGVTDAEHLAIFSNPLQIGILFGLIGGGLGAYWNGYEAIELPLKNRKIDLKKLDEHLINLGYVESQVIDQVKVYERPFPASIFAGKLLVYTDEKTVHISGRSSRVKAFKKLVKNDN